MRRRINRTLLTATAASASVITLGFMATGAVGASTTTAGLASTSSVTPILSQATDCTPPTSVSIPSGCAVAGYQASGRLFRYAQASIVVPNHAGDVTPAGTTTIPQVEPDAAIYVALENSSDTANDYTRVGVMPCALWTATSAAGVTPITGTIPANGCSLPQAYSVTAADTATNTNTSGWETFATAVEPDGTTRGPVYHALDPTQEGLGMAVSVYLSPTGNSVHASIKTPTTYTTGGGVAFLGHTYNDTFAVNGPTYTNADAVADWTAVSTNALTVPFQPAATGVAAGAPGTVAYTQFKDGRFTTWNGTRGTFNGKWTVTPFEATTTGLSTGTVVTSPGYLWSSTTGYKSDAFGVWLRS